MIGCDCGGVLVDRSLVRVNFGTRHMQCGTCGRDWNLQCASGPAPVAFPPSVTTVGYDPTSRADDR